MIKNGKPTNDKNNINIYATYAYFPTIIATSKLAKFTLMSEPGPERHDRCFLVSFITTRVVLRYL
jgi:hypothetical protein